MKITQVVAIALFVVLALSLGACSTTPTGKVVKDDVIRVGIIAPMTGDAASYGEDTAKGIAIALDVLSEQTDKKIDVIYEDVCLAKDALESIQKLVYVDDIDMISGLFCITAIAPVTSITAKEDISVMVTAAVPNRFLEPGQHIFSPNTAIKDDAYIQAEYTYNELGARTASIVWLNSDFGKSYSIYFRERFEELGGEILTDEPLEFFGKDFRSELTKVKLHNPDVVLGIHFGNQMTTLIRQAHELNLNKTIIGDYEVEDKKILASAGEGLKDLVISTSVDNNNLDTEFDERFIEKFGEKPTPLSRFAYDGFVMQVQAHLACDGDRQCILDYLKSIKTFEGASGIFNMSSQGTAMRNFVFKKVVDGEFVISSRTKY